MRLGVARMDHRAVWCGSSGWTQIKLKASMRERISLQAARLDHELQSVLRAGLVWSVSVQQISDMSESLQAKEQHAFAPR